MALRDIVTDPNPTLRKKCREVEVFDEKLGKLLDDMKETMRHADGVGLAGPQVGILRRVAVVEVDDFYIEFVNPVIVKQKGEQDGGEACLSACYRTALKQDVSFSSVLRSLNKTGDFTHTVLASRRACRQTLATGFTSPRMR